MPVTTPEEDTVATLVVPLAQVPPDTESIKLVVDPTHRLLVPAIRLTNGVTVKMTVALVVPTVYEMIQVPAVNAETMPVEEPTAAIVLLLLLHTPPAVESVSSASPPAQTMAMPLIGPTTVTAATCTEWVT